MAKPSEHGNDVCSICEGVFEPDTLLDIDEMEFDLICPVCTRKRLALIPKLAEACRKALEVLDCNWQQHRGEGIDDAEHAARHKLRETIVEVLDGSDS